MKTGRKLTAAILCFVLAMSLCVVASAAYVSRTLFTEVSYGHDCEGTGSIGYNQSTYLYAATGDFEATARLLEPIPSRVTSYIVVWAYDSDGNVLGHSVEEGEDSVSATYRASRSIGSMECSVTFIDDYLGTYALTSTGAVTQIG